MDVTALSPWNKFRPVFKLSSLSILIASTSVRIVPGTLVALLLDFQSLLGKQLLGASNHLERKPTECETLIVL